MEEDASFDSQVAALVQSVGGAETLSNNPFCDDSDFFNFDLTGGKSAFLNKSEKISNSDSDDEDVIESLHTLLQEDCASIQNLPEETVAAPHHQLSSFEKKGGGSKQHDDDTGPQNKPSRNGESERVTTILSFLELRNKGVVDKERWEAVADSSMVYTSPGLPTGKDQANVQFQNKKVEVEMQLPRSYGLQALGCSRELEVRGMLYCHFQSGTNLLTSLEIAVDISSLASQLHSLKILAKRKFCSVALTGGPESPAGSCTTRAGTLTIMPDLPSAAFSAGSPQSRDAKSAARQTAEKNDKPADFKTSSPTPAIRSSSPSNLPPDPLETQIPPRKKRRRRKHRRQQMLLQQQLQMPVGSNAATAGFVAAMRTRSYFALQYFSSQMAAMNAIAPPTASKQEQHTKHQQSSI
eukprot:CAMPEP_0194700662 /NCGR_PEP_ID=MMETSP0295-20121207/25693_1 /TAXON_ID=39354 /ORGANISM="Heterosigma akashiwo, Strain CCMP2393" /LENGTH=408 /DNA_ID=CAMNT_0039594643 /DNA_START=44 /DNA_END=1271 /DNA_ORIENTATION=+